MLIEKISPNCRLRSLIIALVVIVLGSLAYMLMRRPVTPPFQQPDRQLLSTLQECFKSNDQLYPCWDRAIDIYVKENDLPALFESARRARRADSRIENSCHQLMHSVGANVYRQTKDLATALHTCTDECSYGCYHFAIATFLSSEADSSHATIKTLRDKAFALCATKTGNEKLNCAHGLGHAIMMVSSYDKNRSLDTCDSSSDDLIRFNCYQGVYMEVFGPRNITFSFNQHKPYAPCDETEEGRMRECYQYVAPLWVQHFGPEKAMDMCLTLPSSITATCTQGVMTIVYHLKRPISTSVKWCEQQPSATIYLCMRGLIRASIVQYNDVREAREMCEELQSSTLKRECYMMVSQR